MVQILLCTLSLTLLIYSANGVKDSFPIPGSDIQKDPRLQPTPRSAPHGSKLYRIVSDSDVYDDAPYLLDLKGATPKEQGYDMATLLGREYEINFSKVVSYLFGGGPKPKLTQLLNAFLDSQWEYLKQHVPAYMMEELDGMSAASADLGYLQDVGKLAARSVVIANFPSSLETFKYILADEKLHPLPDNAAPLSEEEIALVFDGIRDRYQGLQCSNFGIWGTRTVQGRVMTGRNLDWLKDVGLQQYKLITIHRPVVDGQPGHTHATVGWAGVWGAISGMSEEGLSVHEADLESIDSSFRGFPWMLRLRHVMAMAATLDEAMTVWNASTNTLGFNHGFGSISDNRAVLLETSHGNTAMFGANDAREQDLVVNGVNIAAPRLDAVYRTNHGYDEYSVEHYAWNNTGAYNYSIDRYMMFPGVLDDYAAEGRLMDVEEAINMTAIAADKGDNHFYDCEMPEDSGSVLSTMYDLVYLDMYVAWENGHEDTWTAAACNTYIRMPLRQWFHL